MGPACAVVDARVDGATLWTGWEKPHFGRDGVARVRGLPQDRCTGSGSPAPIPTGATDAHRPAHCLRQQSRVDPGVAGVASIHHARAALDKDAAVIGYFFESKAFSRIDIDTNESHPAYSLAGQLIGLPWKS